MLISDRSKEIIENLMNANWSVNRIGSLQEAWCY